MQSIHSHTFGRPALPILLAAAHDAVVRDGATPNDVDGNSVPDLARSLALCDDTIAHLVAIRREVVDSLAASMEANDVRLPGIGILERTKIPPRVQWNKQAVAVDLADKIIRDLSTDPMTGEMLPPLRQVASRAIAQWQQVFSPGDPKVAFRSQFGFDPDEYRSTDPATGYKVTLRPEGEL